MGPRKDYYRQWREKNREHCNAYRRKYRKKLPLEKKAELAEKKRQKYHGNGNGKCSNGPAQEPGADL